VEGGRGRTRQGRRGGEVRKVRRRQGGRGVVEAKGKVRGG